MLFLVILCIAGIAVPVAAAAPGSLGASAAVIALISVGLFVWYRRVEAKRERAWVGQFSFGDVIARMRAREAIAIPSGVAVG
ncbi:MAG TPA: hypothetical protein VFS53_03520 [Gemmatimonadota bacterium]|nr:hypothetical protein [Gemmatimonadota bacterium]